jgi:hydrogenase nickel incorporation protein HypB
VNTETRDVRLSDHTGSAPAGTVRVVGVQKSLMVANDAAAHANRERFRRCLVVNIVSSPGSGKTALLERTLKDLSGELTAGVIVGDLETDNDARRLRAAGVSAVQVATGTVCHLEAEMVARAAEGLEVSALDLLVIENVGNLVCPAAWDLGEDVRMVLLSVTEGEDKPLKYPRIFKAADVVIFTKLDLAEAAGWDREGALSAIRQVSLQARLFEVSARTGAGMEAWYGYLRERLAAKRSA